MGSKRKRLNELHMEKKNEVLDLIDRGVSERTVAVQFGVANCSAGNKQNRGTVLKAWEENRSSDRQRKLRRTDNDNVNAVTLQFVRLLDQCFKQKPGKLHTGYMLKMFRQAMDGLHRSGQDTTLT